MLRGGGLILVPAITYILHEDEKIARATSIFCIMPMVIASSIFYYKNNFIDWNLGIKCAIGGMIGGVIGAKLLNKMSNKYIKIAFTIFLIYTSIRLLFM